jgi:CBS domain-containing protein
MTMDKEAILQKLLENLKNTKVKEMMTKSIISTSQDAPLYDAALSMLKNKISGMPVVDSKGDLTGVMTITDLFVAMTAIKYGRHLKGEKKLYDEFSVGSIMTEGAVTLTEDNDLSDAIDMMVNQGIHTFPILRDNKLVGVVGRRDIINRFYSILRETIENS